MLIAGIDEAGRGPAIGPMVLSVATIEKKNEEKLRKLGVKDSQKVFTVDASKIAIESFGRAMPNSPMLGAIAKATGMVEMEVLLNDVKKSFGKKFSQKIIDGNIDGVKRGYEEVNEG